MCARICSSPNEVKKTAMMIYSHDAVDPSTRRIHNQQPLLERAIVPYSCVFEINTIWNR